MALFVPGGVAAGGTISGKMGGVVFSRNRFGAYVRSRIVPVNPNTSFQQAARSRVSVLTARWLDTLTDVQRSEWETYGVAVPTVNRVGLTINPTGLNRYLAVNALRLQAGQAIEDDAPAILNLAAYTLPVPTVDQTAQEVSVAFTNTDAWATAVGGALMVWVSRGYNTTRNFFKGPFRFAGRVLGAVVPPTSPQQFALPFTVTADQKVGVRFNVFNDDNRAGSPQISQVVVIV